ncbi:uncharacterized protein LOC142355786 [Convolutriloba macropyga]|uniref:uncharacterized protein LOC142355786 n=1 Tax=Convolutriloba macropyga TaxID=536237 RepID=UPI003F527A5C
MRDINYDDVFDTHLKAQGSQFGDNLEAVCFIKCLVTPFREPSNFFYFFALSDTNKSGGLDTVEFKRMLYNKFKTAGKGKEEKIDSLMEEYFPSDEPDNVLYSFFKKVSGRNEVSITTYVQAFPQDLLQECTCSEYIHQCIASH